MINKGKYGKYKIIGLNVRVVKTKHTEIVIEINLYYWYIDIYLKR